MSLTIRPYTGESGWHAAHNPVVFRMDRQDYPIGTITSGTGGRVKLTITGVNVAADFIAGDDVYFKDEGDYSSGIRTGVYSNGVFTGGNTEVLLEYLYISALDTSGYVNLTSRRSNYRVDVQVWQTELVAGDSLLNENTFTYSPFVNGELVVDVGAIVRSYLYSAWENQTTGYMNNKVELGSSLQIFITAQEFYTGSASAVEESDIVFVVNAAMQFKDEFGSDMANYVAELVGDPKRFLCRFDLVKIYRNEDDTLSNWPSTLSFIFPDLAADTYWLDIHFKDVNGVAQVTESYEQDPVNKRNTVNRIAFPQTAASRLATYATVEFRHNDGMDDFILLRQECVFINVCARPIMLVWKNSLGGDACYMFTYNQELSTGINGDTKYKSMMLYTDNISFNDWECLCELINPNEIYVRHLEELTSDIEGTRFRKGQMVYVVDNDGVKTPVIVKTKSAGTRTKNVLHPFAVEIEYPEIFSQQ